MKKTVLIGITGGIAAYKMLDVIKQLKDHAFEIQVILSSSAQKLIDREEIKKITGNDVFTSLYAADFDLQKVLQERKVDHIELADSADVMLIAPATANIIGKLAHGIADDILTTTALAVTAPTIICPSMNVNMWHNPVVQENISKLKKHGFIVIEPESGMLACGYEGKGRLPKKEVIVDEVIRSAQFAKSLSGKKVVITAGGTVEPIDEVRFIGNRSSGKMGVVLAEECYARGAEVILLRSKNSVEPRYHFQQELFETFDDLNALMQKYCKEVDLVIHAAAVSDFSVEKHEGKLESNSEKDLELKPRTKILDSLKKLSDKMFLVGFKAEYKMSEEELVKKARERIESSKADLMVVNEIGKEDRGFNSDTNEVLLVTDSQTQRIPLASKKEIAGKIMDYVVEKIS